MPDRFSSSLSLIQDPTSRGHLCLFQVLPRFSIFEQGLLVQWGSISIFGSFLLSQHGLFLPTVRAIKEQIDVRLFVSVRIYICLFRSLSRSADRSAKKAAREPEFHAQISLIHLKDKSKKLLKMERSQNWKEARKVSTC